jgi:hypothetical protein
MAKEFITSAKELAYKAWCHNNVPDGLDEFSAPKELFEHWWSVNYGNIDSTKFIPEHNVYVEGHRYIKAE